ncbi:uncharacterized protein H6S33_011990 [Morchella sextelata]|uniref:uncharacterized protein n=1 Tax=Morchella sextelata TaxID=1174677 RepID=UPI001D05BBD7|nr:uncharacterized protein H6S33_011990 [Morchella sextelata]KAH0610463.1 hypothetical protein H6S33_011990 [Morchella sextelata]
MTSDAHPPPSAPSAAALLEEDGDDDYRSSEDEDFDPTTAAAAAVSENSGSDSDSDSDSGAKSKSKPKPKKRATKKRQREQSDDPAPTRKIKTRAHRRLHGDHNPDDEESHTAVLAAAKAQDATDVDALWAAMNSPAVVVAEKKEEEEEEEEEAEKTDGTEGKTEGETEKAGKGKIHEEETVTISRTYTFAGQEHTEHKVVPRDSQEAQAYLASLPAPSSTPSTPTTAANTQGTKPRRAAPKKRVSAFDSAAAARKPHTPPAQKMNTLEKSRLDWAGFVDKEGIGEELRRHKMGEKAYLERQAFLGRVEERGEMVLKEGRRKGP